MTTALVPVGQRAPVTDRTTVTTTPSRRRWLRLVALLVAAVAVVWFAGRELPSWSELVAAFGRVDLPLLGVAAVLEVFSLWLFVRQQQVLFAGFGTHVPVGSAVAITASRSAMSMTFPAGSLVSAVFAVEQFRRFGASRSTATTVMVLSGVMSILGLSGLYGIGALATWLFPRPWQVVVAVVGALCATYLAVGIAFRRDLPVRAPTATPPLPARPMGRVATLVRARLADVATLPGRYWAGGIGYATANWAADLACLVVTSAAFGVDVPALQIGVLYLGVQLLRQVPLSPGGIGLIETSLVAGLVLLGADPAAAAAATLGYRLLSCWLVVPVGLTTWFSLTRTSRRFGTE